MAGDSHGNRRAHPRGSQETKSSRRPRASIFRLSRMVSRMVKGRSAPCDCGYPRRGIFRTLVEASHVGGPAYYPILKIDNTQAGRLQTSRHTLCRGGQLHGHPSAHSPAPHRPTSLQRPSSPSRASSYLADPVTWSYRAGRCTVLVKFTAECGHIAVIPRARRATLMRTSIDGAYPSAQRRQRHPWTRRR